MKARAAVFWSCLLLTLGLLAPPAGAGETWFAFCRDQRVAYEHSPGHGGFLLLQIRPKEDRQPPDFVPFWQDVATFNETYRTGTAVCGSSEVPRNTPPNRLRELDYTELCINRETRSIVLRKHSYDEQTGPYTEHYLYCRARIEVQPQGGQPPSPWYPRLKQHKPHLERWGLHRITP